MKTKLLEKLIDAHFKNDEQAFLDFTRRIIQHQRSKGRSWSADRLSEHLPDSHVRGREITGVVLDEYAGFEKANLAKLGAKPELTLFSMPVIENPYLPENHVALRAPDGGMIIVNLETQTAIIIEKPVDYWKDYLPVRPSLQCETRDAKGNLCPQPAFLRTAESGEKFFACDDCYGRYLWAKELCKMTGPITGFIRKNKYSIIKKDCKS